MRCPSFLTGCAAAAAVMLVAWYLCRRMRQVTQLEDPPSPFRHHAGAGVHQRAVLQHVVPPAAISVTWADVAGLDDLVKSIKRQVIFPMRSTLSQLDPLMRPPRGVLLYGPPGCGKTMVAKAIAKDVNAIFLNFDVSSIKNKFVGETEKMTAALFSTAHRLQPCVIFVDEADAFLGTRGDADCGTDMNMKAQFLTLWDGLTTDSTARILILAATNRRDAIDTAILRRLPLQFELPLPSLDQRLDILRVTLQHTPLASDVDLLLIAVRSEGFSGSDLYELCRYAAITRFVREAEGASPSSTTFIGQYTVGPLTMNDFLNAFANARDIGEKDKPPSHIYL